MQKSGRTTEYTTGKITDIDATVTINYGIYSANHDHVIVTDSMGSPGDSGSLLVDMNKKAVGLLFGGSPGTVVFYSKIRNVLDALNIEFLPCGTSCLLGPISCKLGGPGTICKLGGPISICKIGGPNIVCTLGGPDSSICKPGGPILTCKPGGPITACKIGGPSMGCSLGPEILACKAGPIVGCMAGPPLMEDPKGKIVSPVDVAGQIVIDTTKLTDAEKLNVGKLVNKLRGID